MKRPFANKRVIGPFAQLDGSLTKFAQLDDSLTNSEFDGDSIRKQVYNVMTNIPEWAKDSDTFVDYTLDNYKDLIMDLSSSTKETGNEHTVSICYNGDQVYITDIVEGGETSAPASPCTDKAVRLADIHTHPIGEQAFPSVTDVDYAHAGVTGIPMHFNSLVFRPEPERRRVEGHGTCFNLYSLKARCVANEIASEFYDNDNLDKAQKMIREVLIEDHGTKFEIEK